MTATSIFEDGGFEVLEADTADEAIRLLETKPDIALVFTDIEMPGSMDGLRLMAVIRERWPPIKLIVTSGRLRATDHEFPSDVVFLDKPYDPGKILRKASALLNRSGL
jgi:CheY-like chemotaxis protein